MARDGFEKDGVSVVTDIFCSISCKKDGLLFLLPVSLIVGLKVPVVVFLKVVVLAANIFCSMKTEKEGLLGCCLVVSPVLVDLFGILLGAVVG